MMLTMMFITEDMCMSLIACLNQCCFFFRTFFWCENMHKIAEEFNGSIYLSIFLCIFAKRFAKVHDRFCMAKCEECTIVCVCFWTFDKYQGQVAVARLFVAENLFIFVLVSAADALFSFCKSLPRAFQNLSINASFSSQEQAIWLNINCIQNEWSFHNEVR